MRQEAVQIIGDEHLVISAVLYTLRHLVRQMRDEGAAPDFDLLSAILDYIVAYPERWPHPKEDRHHFAAVRRRTHDADGLIAPLEREHARGAAMVEGLQRGLIAFRQADAGTHGAFFDSVERCAEFECSHMRVEEDLLLPLAERVLTANDWRAILVAFRANDHKLSGIRPRAEAEHLHQRIFSLAPAPVGFGEGC